MTEQSFDLKQAKRKKQIASIRRALLRWFKLHARDLPWRRTRDPYCIWLSEIMLQQTRVDTVVPYYRHFVQTLPNVNALANASHDQLMKLWEGLGYYRRAQNLHKAAKIIREQYGGEYPRSVEEWRALPGIGDYTAGAIVSIAFDRAEPAIDGNAKRVLSRLFCIHHPVGSSMASQLYHTLGKSLISKTYPGAFNQAMMELGARICLPRDPLCERCPVEKHCDAYKTSQQHDLPLRKAKKEIPHRHVVAAAIRKNGRYLLGKRPQGGMLEGLWEFPGGKVEEDETYEEALQRELKEELGVEVQVHEAITSVDHTYSHLRVTLHLYACEIVEGKPRALYHDEVQWIGRHKLRELAFPAANLKLIDHLESC